MRTECQSSLVSQPPRSNRPAVADASGPSFSLSAWREVAAGVYLVVAEPASVNVGLVVGQESALVVDTGSSPAQGALLRAAVATVTDLPLLGAVVTHAHYDHFFGLAAFDDLTTWGHESLADDLATIGTADSAAELGVAVTDLTAPQRLIAVAAGIDLGGRRVEVAHLGPGHTSGDLVVVVPDADVLFTGDLVESAPAATDGGDARPGAPWYGPDSRPDDWATTLDSVVGLMTDRTRAIPGHGVPVDREFVFEQRGRVAAVAGEVRRLADAGVPLDQALDRGNWAFPPDHIAAGLAAAYALIGPRRNLPLV
jgi:glyoxylase-like metal-dependent hydrolase (beta-lactamase superfamily II)